MGRTKLIKVPLSNLNYKFISPYRNSSCTKHYVMLIKDGGITNFVWFLKLNILLLL